MKLSKSFYLRSDVVEISKDLLGKYLFTYVDKQLTAGIITETEAYCGARDKACHAYLNRNTKRTKVMFEEGGLAYVYLCYGIHHLFNIVTNIAGQADAVLVRAILPKVGIDTMLERRGHLTITPKLSAGPGTLSKALGIDKTLYGADLTKDTIWIEDKNMEVRPQDIEATPRVGIDYAEEDALLPWRFVLKNINRLGSVS